MCCGRGRHSEVCLRLGKVESREWQTMYGLRSVLGGVRSLFRLVVSKCIFMFKSSSLVNPKDL